MALQPCKDSRGGVVGGAEEGADLVTLEMLAVGSVTGVRDGEESLLESGKILLANGDAEGDGLICAVVLEV